jgi:hypothetical protein
LSPTSTSPGGRNIRARTSVNVDGAYQFDFGPDAYHQALAGNDLSLVEHLIFTHVHSAHLAPGDLGMRQVPFAHGVEAPLQVWGNDRVLAGLARQSAELAAVHKRLRIARDLHDTVSQILFGIHLLLPTGGRARPRRGGCTFQEAQGEVFALLLRWRGAHSGIRSVPCPWRPRGPQRLSAAQGMPPPPPKPPRGCLGHVSLRSSRRPPRRRRRSPPVAVLRHPEQGVATRRP